MKDTNRAIIALAKVIADNQDTIGFMNDINLNTMEDLEVSTRLIKRLAKMLGIEIPDIDATANCPECAPIIDASAPQDYSCKTCGVEWKARAKEAAQERKIYTWDKSPIKCKTCGREVREGERHNCFFVPSDDNGV